MRMWSRRGLLGGAIAVLAAVALPARAQNATPEQLRAAIARMRVGGRVALCGAISQYNATEPVPGPDNLALAIGGRSGSASRLKLTARIAAEIPGTNAVIEYPGDITIVDRAFSNP